MKKISSTVILASVLVLCLIVMGTLIAVLVIPPKDCAHAVCHKELHEPECDEKGYTLYTCTNCGYAFEADFVAPLGHDFTDEVVAPTCDKEGYTAHSCSVCGIVDKDNYVRPTGHTYSESTVEPTCEELGYTLHKCDDCAFEVKSDYVAPKGHLTNQTVVAPTCDEEGYTVHKCKNCSYEYINEITAPTGHDFEKTYIRPNLEKTGYTEYKCKVCGSTHKADFVFYSDIFTGAEGEGRGELAWGLDLSHHSADVDFEALKALGIDFVILRVGYNTSLDTRFEEYFAKAKAAGLDIGIYFFTLAENAEDAKADAKRVADWLRGKQFEYPVFYDIEDYAGAGYYPSDFSEEQIMGIAHTFMTEMVEYGYYPGLYTNNYFLYSLYNNEKALRLYDIWYARYTDTPDDYIDDYSAKYSMWQYAGSVEGFGNGAVSGMCDVNYAFKNYPAIIKKFGFNGYQ